MRHVIHPFEPIIDKNSKLLILGSVPSVKSVENGFYYMHPQNRFWKVLGALLDENFTVMTANQKTAALIRYNVALYDVVFECDLSGSSDLSVKNAVPADIPKMIEGSKIKKIFCNGKLSYDMLMKYYPKLAEMTSRMPSTSPANAKSGIDSLTAAWAEILDI